EEKDIPSHFFPLNPTNDRTIYFKGWYIRIVNKEIGDVKTYIDNIDNEVPITKYAPYKIPTGYTYYIRGVSVYFKT
ncbi:uncharacterized protein K441DRAFT_577860, partial [Cenococcum geophilum 1.58]|uniref:uncharacterized protein n=1 Tax=Cenococcum geophilum 1.58 TaxID=794803 RepID=UPI00358FFD88